MRKPTNREIDLAKISNSVSSAVVPSNEHVFNEGFEKGAKWTRDFDPWRYPQDGDFPELERDMSEIKFSRGVLAFIEDEPEIVHYIFQKDEEEYQWLDDALDPHSTDAIKCWMHIPEPKR